MSNQQLQDTGNNPPLSPLSKGGSKRGLFPLNKWEVKGGHRASIILLLLAFLFLPSLAVATMENYCIVPPYVKRDTSVNIMIFMDNSKDMLEYAHKGDVDTEADGDNDYYCGTSVKDSCFAGGKYIREYYGYFDPYGCYKTNKFEKQGTVNYSAPGQELTGCPAAQFNGNILNWALMSRFSVAKKVIVGGKYSEPKFYLEGKDMPIRTSEGCTWKLDFTGNNLKDLLVSEAGGLCPYPKGTFDADEIRRTTEPTTGILQEFTDSDNNNNFDKNSPRLGIAEFTGTNASITVYIPPSGTYESFLNSVRNMNTVTLNDLATGLFVVIGYFDDDGIITSRDPYKGCASWEKPPCVEGVAVPCRKSAVLMVTTGTDVGGKPYPSGTSCTNPGGSCLTGNAAYAYNNDLRSDTDMPGKQNVSTYVIHTFGSIANQTVLQNTATQGGGTYYSAGADNLADVLRQALQDIIKRAAAGTAASVLASGEGSGASLIQAIFYPRSPTLAKGGIFSEEIDWIGRLSNYWYYVDPFFGGSSIREDTVADFKLNLKNDYAATFYYDPIAEQTKAELLEDTNADGYGDVCRFGPRTGVTYNPACTNPSKVFEKINNLWEAGVELWERTSPRTIKTTIGGGLIDFSTARAADATFRSYLQAADATEAENIINYTHGVDISGYRSRTTAVDLDGDGVISVGNESRKVWKLGDILNSTPKIASYLQLNTYEQIFGDTTYKHYLDSSNYKNKGAVFAGGNDGMLHAFKLGKLELKNSATCAIGANDKACLTNPDAATPLGHELWAFIPKNVLPYLKYLTDPGYCHIFTVDLTPYVFDASINAPAGCAGDYWNCNKQTKCGTNAECTAVNNTLDMANTSWRTILIGGMRYGGACREPGSAGTDNVKTPVAGLGYSSYFALDVTDENNPQLLWEFSNPNLGFTTTGPAVVRISAKHENGSPVHTKNGRWFVVFGSGPTGPIDTTVQQFMGRSDQNLRLFVLDLKTGNLLRTIDTDIANAFAGSMLNSTHNVDPPDYQDDVVYIPYVKKLALGTTWTDGGVLRLLTKTDLNPANWVWSRVMDGIGPVTSSVQRLQHQTQKKLWLYFGTGRYFFEKAAETDDGTTQRHLFGITEPCFINGAFSADCTTTNGTGLTRAIGDLTQVDLTTAAGVNDPEGWYILLDLCTTAAGTPVDCGHSTAYYRTERVITDPLTTTTGLVFFTAYKPYKDECSLGGKSHIWALKYDTGGAPGALLKGIALVQVSTGAIEQIDLSTAFTLAGGRKSGALEGVPPTAQGLSLMSSPPPVKRVLHMRER